MEGMTMDDPTVITVGDGGGSTLLNESYLDVVMQLPLPGIVIFVHGVNSDGEWFQAAEEGLCKGLNTRMARNDGQILHSGIEGGKLTPVSYLPDLTSDGYLNPKKTSKKFIDGDANFSPVIHFRWGYKAAAKDMQTYGDALYLNERDYWGGGPFANGCTAIPDLWEGGLNDQLFLWLHAQHLNPTNDRMVYACPHRGYYVVAALRLARLIGEIRKKQADVPVTIVCHSQGNMVSIAAAFLGDRLGQVKDGAEKPGNCVANTYVLCNPPYSLLKDNKTEGWTQIATGSRETGYGRQTYEARIGTLKHFFEIMQQQAKAQSAADIDECSANAAHDFTTEKDRNKYGYGPGNASNGRVTLYFNPHDQVISSTTIQGIGWRGMSAAEIGDAGGAGIFCQRVFAQGFSVGGPEQVYRFWEDHHVKGPDGKPLPPKSNQFWYPESPKVKYSIKKGMDANKSMLPKILTAATALFLYPILKMVDVRINGLPDDGWATPLTAPSLGDKAFPPQSLRFGQRSDRFDEGLDAPGFSRNKSLQRDADDPYGGERDLPTDPRDAEDAPRTDAALGDTGTEGSMMYEHHAFLRMRARREGKYGKQAAVTEEDDLTTANDDYKTWRNGKIRQLLVENVGTRATDHSSILTNPDHSEKALAYDIPVGVCHIAKEDLADLRKMADWRFLDGVPKSNLISKFDEYFKLGTMGDKTVADWAKEDGSDATLPPKVINKRSVF
jgi:pimeloyl-ACP methyl ester carboxylesterase